MRVAVIGSGAVGLGLGSLLCDAGDRVVFVARDPVTREALEAHGLRRSGIFGEAAHAPASVDVVNSLSELRDRFDVLLVCAKSTATEGIASALATVWRDLGTPPVVLCQNGWGNAEIFARTLPKDRVFNARVITGFRRASPAHVEITVHAEPVTVGSVFDPAHADAEPALTTLAAQLANAGLPCEVMPDVRKDLLAKLLYNCALNPLGAILGVPYGELGERAETRAILEAVVHEVFAVLAAHGLETHWPDADAYLADFYAKLLPPTAAHESSMLQDLRAGRPTEIDALSGAVVRMARTKGVDATTNQALRELVRALSAP